MPHFNPLAGETLSAGRLASAIPKGRIAQETSTSAVTLSSASTVFDTDAVTTVVNTDTVERRYMATVTARFNMAGGSTAIYRPVVSNGSGSNLGDTTVQVHTTVTGGPGQVGGRQEYHFTLAPSASQTVAAAGLRSGGSASDAIGNGAILRVYDLGPT